MTDTIAPGAAVIYLNQHEIQCAICDGSWVSSPAGPSFSVPMYEDEILPDNDPGEWAGQPVCPRCYLVVRGLQSETKERRIATSEVRRCLEAHGVAK